MTEQDIFKTVVSCLETALEKKLPDVKPEDNLETDLGMESLQMTILQIELEDSFHYSFDSLEDNFQVIFSSVGSICLFFAEKLQ